MHTVAAGIAVTYIALFLQAQGDFLRCPLHILNSGLVGDIGGVGGTWWGWIRGVYSLYISCVWLTLSGLCRRKKKKYGRLSQWRDRGES